MVIVLLGILAAFALSRFANLTSAANIAVLDSVGGAILSATNIVHTKALVLGVQGQQNAAIDLNGDGVDDIEVRFGYPNARRDLSGFRAPNNLLKSLDSSFLTDL